jgi:hypothetical protein
MPGEQEGPTGVLVSSILALMAFLLAVTMGMASDRFDTRRQLVVQEANAISKAYLEAGYLPQPADDQVKELLREYLPLRIANTSDRSVVQANFQKSQDLHAQMWAIFEPYARSGSLTDLMSSLGESLTEIRTLNETRYLRPSSCFFWRGRRCRLAWSATARASRVEGACSARWCWWWSSARS